MEAMVATATKAAEEARKMADKAQAQAASWCDDMGTQSPGSTALSSTRHRASPWTPKTLEIKCFFRL